MFSNYTDIVIPLGSGSRYDNFELRMALRSITYYAVNVRNIYIISDAPPTWLCNVKTLAVPDKHRHNKDANIIDKILAATDLPELSDTFLFWSDDQLALYRFDAAKLPVSCNPRRYEHFSGNRIWHRRMRNTFEYLQRHNIFLNCNFDSHIPLPIRKNMFREVMRKTDYAAEPGFCINTLYCGLTGLRGGIPQHAIKYTAETAENLLALPANKLFLGYNDAAMNGDLPQLLSKHFNKKCKYEK